MRELTVMRLAPEAFGVQALIHFAADMDGRNWYWNPDVEAEAARYRVAWIELFVADLRQHLPAFWTLEFHDAFPCQ
jgi:hypothetical protein